MSRIIVTFGSVPAGITRCQKVVLKNEELHDVNYTFTYPCKKLTLDYVFNVTFPTNVTIRSERCMEFCVYFSPTVPNQDYIDYFIFEDQKLRKIVHLTCQGSSSGPRVSFDLDKIVFSSTDTTNNQLMKTVRLTNNSEVCAHFTWLMNSNECGPFKITNLSGIIEPFKSLNCCVVFNEFYHGTFEEDLVCLVHHQEPLILCVKGKKSNLGIIDLEEEYVPQKKLKTTCNFTTVMEDMINIRPDVPMVSVSASYLDFGLGSAYDVTWNISQVFSISNHSHETGQIVWYRESQDIFLVEPKHLTIEPQGVKDFVVKFRPRHPERLYSSILIGVFTTNRNEGFQNVRHTFRIPVIGRTCSGPSPLKPKCEMPKRIIFPPTVPFFSVFISFLLKNVGQFPVLYKFVPPEKSNIIVMPMCGRMDPSDWTIILAALHPTCSGFYVEEWKVVFDSSSEIVFQFYGSAEVIQYSITIHKQLDLIRGSAFLSVEDAVYPSLQGDEDTYSKNYNQCKIKSNGFQDISKIKEIGFDVTSPGGESACVIFVQNLTRNYLHIRLLGNMEWLNADGDGEIVIRPNEVNSFCLFFNPKSEGKYNSIITFAAIALNKGKPIGVPHDTCLRVIGYCSSVKMQVLPKNVDLGQIECGYKAETKFSLVNIGCCPLHFKLNVIQRNINNEQVDGNKLLVHPQKGTLQAGNYCNIDIQLTPEKCDNFYVKIFCVIRKGMSNDDAVSTELDNFLIFNFHYEGIYPTFQVYGIKCIQSSKMFSEVMLWKMLNIDKLNAALLRVTLNSVEEIEMEVPASQANTCPTQLGLMLRGENSSHCKLSLCRHKLCNCPLLRQSRKMTFVEHVYNCPHRALLQLSPLSGELNPKSLLMLNLEVKYCLTGEHALAYNLSLHPNRKIQLIFNIKVTEEVSAWLWPLYHSDEWDEVKEHEKSIFYLNVGKVFIGNHDPVFRWFTLHNTIAECVKWQLLKANTSPDAAIRCVTGIFKAQPDNPICIMFSFKPIESIYYEEKFMGILNYRKVFIIVRGEGTLCSSINPPIEIPKNILQQKIYLPSNTFVHLSSEYIHINSMITKRSVTRMIAINNPTTQVIQFKWNKICLPQSLSCYMTPEMDIIQPKQRKWILFNIYSEEQPTYVTQQIRCDLLDLSERRLLKKDRDIYQRYEPYECEQNYDNCCDEEVQINRKLDKKSIYLTLSVSTTSVRDVSSHRQKKIDTNLWSPHQKSTVNKKNLLQMKYCNFFMEELIWTTLNSEIIKRKLRNLHNSNIPTYIQFVKAHREKTQHNLDQRNMSSIFEGLIFESLLVYDKDRK